uniref:Uncharacterized protein n=1 Tax=Enterobacter cloacae TaxID=550 RepID=A0A8D5Y6Y0_ENTCL|nr:hypothetical protein [Klebsiella pneumoniae]BCR34626.1 hypothetical protein [Escherichia coli]BCR34738.1 hypothetical protein [Enterobacter cloacae]BCR34514.1 hypothetical protein [Klebsiella pneumoniae]BCR34850.1 hypothetical protein [Klebsiella pneumoniae]
MVEESAAWVQEAVQQLAAVGAVPVVVGLAPAADFVPVLFAVVAVAPVTADLRATRNWPAAIEQYHHQAQLEPFAAALRYQSVHQLQIQNLPKTVRP